MRACYQNVTKAAPNVRVLGGRCGTARCARATLDAALGRWSYGNTADDKVTVAWVFNTPRGPAEVRDYWWNAPDEWSIAAQNYKAARWLMGYLRTHGIPTHYGMPRAPIRLRPIVSPASPYVAVT